MGVHEAIPFSVRIERTRNRLIAVSGVLVALTSLASWIGNRSQLLAIAFPEPAFGWFSLSGASLGLCAAGLAFLGRRRIGAAILALGIAAQSTFMVLRIDLPYEIALSAYVGVLLVAVLGTSRNEALVVTGIIVVIGVATYLLRPAHTAPMQGVLAIVGLLSVAGVTLGWLQHSLLSAIGQLEVSQAHLHRLSHMDPLTGLGNRRMFDENLNQQLRYVNRERPLALVLIDVDKLKTINDRHGHPVGDKALKLVAEAIRESTRESDSSARIGGDEFGILLPTGGHTGARRVADRIHELLGAWRKDGRNGMDLSVSIGVAEARHRDHGVAQLLSEADADMYAGRNGPH